MPKRLDGTLVTDGFNFDGGYTVTTEHDVTKILPDEDNKVDLGSSAKRFKNIYWASLTPDPGTGYLPLSGGTMSGAINMGNQEITNCNALRVPSNSVLIGDAKTSNDGIGAVIIGPNSVLSNSAGSVLVGYGSNITNSTDCLALGRGSFISGAPNSVAIGTSTIIGGQYGVAVGQGAGISAAMQTGVALGFQSIVDANNAISLGANITNNQANSLLVNSSSNIRSSSTTCDLGTIANPFQNLYLNGFALSSSSANRIPSFRCSYSDSKTGFSATTVESNMIDGTLYGSLTVPAPTSAGFTVKISQSWMFSAGAATTFTIRLKINGTTVQTTVVPATAVTNLSCILESTMQLRTPSNRLYSNCNISRNGLVPIVNAAIADNVWNPAAANTISMTGQFSDTNGTFRCDHFDMWTSKAS